MNLDLLLERLDSVTPAGDDQFNAKCPAHDDRSASLSIGTGYGRVLLHCHAGCESGAVLGQLGLEWGDLFDGASNGNDGPVRIAAPTAPPERPAPRRRRQEPERSGLPPAPVLEHWRAAIEGDVADRLAELKGWSLETLQSLHIGWDGERITIPIHDAEGRLETVMRYLPGGRPKMIALGGRGRHLFPAPEAAITHGPVLWLVEGEPDAISARELGVPAVSVPGIATWKQEWGARFAGRRVVVCMDCDEGGRGAARLRTAALIRAGVLAWHTDLAPDRDDGFDLSEALQVASAEGRLGDLRAYLRRLEEGAVGDG